ncbi:MAG TPA: hypothetical protein VNA89_12095 [Gemmatimonadaceae bacterium]|nr:hypothetical protein [Gemmatimonadaceae bacterium]
MVDGAGEERARRGRRGGDPAIELGFDGGVEHRERVVGVEEPVLDRRLARGRALERSEEQVEPGVCPVAEEPSDRDRTDEAGGV